MKSKINLRIRNSLPYAVPLSFFSKTESLYSPNAIINQKKQYIWDVTTEPFLFSQSVSIEVKRTGEISFETLTAEVTQSNLEGVVNALNGLDVGLFFSYTQGGSTFITTLNDSFVYGNLDISPFQATVTGFIGFAFWSSGWLNNITQLLTLNSTGVVTLCAAVWVQVNDDSGITSITATAKGTGLPDIPIVKAWAGTGWYSFAIPMQQTDLVNYETVDFVTNTGVLITTVTRGIGFDGPAVPLLASLWDQTFPIQSVFIMDWINIIQGWTCGGNQTGSTLRWLTGTSYNRIGSVISVPQPFTYVNGTDNGDIGVDTGQTNLEIVTDGTGIVNNTFLALEFEIDLTVSATQDVGTIMQPALATHYWFGVIF